MRICHVNLASGFSGGERQTLQLIKQQLTLNYQLTVVANPVSPFYAEIEKLNCTLIAATHFLKSHRRSITADCQLIHVHEGRAIYWALIQSKLFNVPYIVTRRIDNPLKDKFLSKLAYNNASALIGLSKEIVKQIQLRHPDHLSAIIPSSPVTYPYNDTVVDAIKQRFDGKFLVIQAANLLEHKGHDVTIQAAKILAERNPNIHIAILGDGRERASLELQAQGLSNVSFEGKQSSMGEWFKAADLLIHPSYSEGLGSVILEAINAGLPAIGSNAGGIPDIIEHNKSGLLIEPGDAKALANHIDEIAKNSDLRAQLIIGGAEKMHSFDIRHTATLYQSLYQKVIDNVAK
ncbi:glycosyltransferase family 4 protein [Vibrio sp. YIC-376]|uniref:glycosyltransferase family 4 protein n=1 Tax=Vibrio sp. YIC-376 TaxID=3136162 RepID=UPI00402A73A3